MSLLFSFCARAGVGRRMARPWGLLLLSWASLALCRRCGVSEVIQPDGSYSLSGCDELSLFGAHVGDEGAQKLAEALEADPPLSLLDLWANGIGEAGARALGRALQKNTHLQRLYLNENPLGAAGVAAIAEGLTKAMAPRHLWLSRTGGTFLSCWPKCT